MEQENNSQINTHTEPEQVAPGATTVVSKDVSTEQAPKDAPVTHHTKNLYPTVRHTILVIVVIFFVALILFLMHQNGKSIYDNGI